MMGVNVLRSPFTKLSKGHNVFTYKCQCCITVMLPLLKTITNCRVILRFCMVNSVLSQDVSTHKERKRDIYRLTYQVQFCPHRNQPDG